MARSRAATLTLLYYGIDELSRWFPRWGGSHRSVKVLVCLTDDCFLAVDQRMRSETNPDVCTFNTIGLEETRVNYKGVRPKSDPRLPCSSFARRTYSISPAFTRTRRVTSAGSTQDC